MLMVMDRPSATLTVYALLFLIFAIGSLLSLAKEDVTIIDFIVIGGLGFLVGISPAGDFVGQVLRG